MVAAAITTPVTNAAKHENSRRSFSTPVMAASPMRASHVGVSSPEGSSALLYRGGNVTSRSASYAEQSWREERLSPLRTPDERAGSGLHQRSWRGAGPRPRSKRYNRRRSFTRSPRRRGRARRWHGEAEHPGSLSIVDQLELGPCTTGLLKRTFTAARCKGACRRAAAT